LLLKSAKIAPPPSLLLIKVNAKAGGLALLTELARRLKVSP
jgi:hypothetical protein